MTPERWHRIKELFESALERPPEERYVFLDHACDGDEFLRKEVESLIASHEQTGSFIDSPAYELGAELLTEDHAELAVGQRIAHYEIVALLGSGGMGEVYLAHDTKLGREIALKLLPVQFTTNKDRLRRFEQEAHAASTLSHPNVCVIYEVGETEQGRHYIAMEYVDGVTLRQHMTEARLKLSEVLDVAVQVASGLAAAHDLGVVHRDVKPENIMLRRDGYIKVLDFGLAKLTEHPTTNFTTAAGAPVKTDTGVVMGTVGYMSPEQVRGEDADHRSDIFSFGSILYEMLSGQRAFRRETMAETMTAILKEEPPELSETKAKISLPLEKILRRCLEKKLERRFQSANDLAFALEALSTPSGSGLQPATSMTAATDGRAVAGRTWFTRNGLLAWVAAGVLFVAALILAIPYFFQRAPAAPAMTRFIISPPEKLIIESLALSPDGIRLAFSGRDESGKTLIWIRALDTLMTQALPGTEGARFPFWSPDSRSIGFFADSKLKRIEIAGGSIQMLADTSLEPRGASWGHDGTILFSPGTLSPIYRVSATGSSTSPVTEIVQSRNENSHRWPYWLPDGRHFIYFARGAQKEKQALFLASLDSTNPKLLLNVASSVAYMPADISSRSPGLLLFMRDRALMAQPFDADKQKLFGEPHAIAEDVMHYGEIGPTDLGVFSISTNGVLCYQTGDKSVSQLTWFDRSGKQLGTVGSAGSFIEPALSPDGKRVAVTMEKEGDPADIWILELARSTFTRFTFAPHLDQRPSWSPDGSRIVFGSDRNGFGELYQKLSNGVGSDELLLAGHPDQNMMPDDWSLDGRFIIYNGGRTGTSSDLWILPLEGDLKPYPFLQTQFNESHAKFSPNVKWVAYVSDETGRAEVYVQSFPASGGKWQISIGGGDQPQWRRDGKELFYLSPERKIMAVQVKSGATFEIGVPAPLFQTGVNPTTSTNARNNYVIAADGQRFLVNNVVPETASKPVTVVLNWPVQLKK
jgi:Tol biopolymer transport system component/predicted Ser/Thr protein kinase